MEIYFYDKNSKKEVKLTLEVGSEWKKSLTGNKKLNSIFSKIDNGDGIISQTELDMLNMMLKEVDYNKDGIANDNEINSMNYLDKKDYEKRRNNFEVAEKIHDDIFAKNVFGLPTTGKNIGKHIASINQDNVLDIMKIYSEKTNGEESLLSGIMSEVGLPMKDRMKYCKHIITQIANKYKDNGVYIEDILKEFDNELNYQKEKWTPTDAERLNATVKKIEKRAIAKSHFNQKNNSLPNGKIDKDFQQSNTGDCWLLAGIKAISSTPKGLQILNDSVKVDQKGNVTVTLKGAQKSYTFSQKEILGNVQFSTGDLDVRAIEMAMDRFFAEEHGSKNTRNKIDLDGNRMHVAYQLLTGKGGYKSFWPEDSNGDHKFNPDHYKTTITDEQIKNFNKPNHVVTVSTHGKNDITFSSSNDKNIKLYANHAYAVSRSDKDFVYIINPWDTSKEIPVKIQTFKEFFNNIEEFDL